MPEELTIRERIQSYQNEILAGSLMPQRASEILTEISALLGNINEQIKNCDIAYNKVLLGFYETEEKANRAKIKADISPEYEAMRDARNVEKVATELIKSLKYLLRSMENEFRQGGSF